MLSMLQEEMSVVKEQGGVEMVAKWDSVDISPSMSVDKEKGGVEMVAK